MKNSSIKLAIYLFVAASFIAAPAFSYEILLDIDTDNDPATINTSTEDTSAVVKIVLMPAAQGETIGAVCFGLGGECLPCPPNGIDGVQNYGVSFDLPLVGPWVTAPGFDSEAGYMTLLGCPGNPGYHMVLSFEPEGGGTMVLNGPVFLAEFNAWVNPTVPDGCPRPSGILMSMPSQGQWWGYVLFGGAEAPNDSETGSWGKIKKIYRQ